MIGFVTIATTHMKRARSFYDSLLGSIGAIQCNNPSTNICLYASGFGTMFGLRRVASHDAHVGVTVGFSLQNRGEVDRFHALALALGAAQEVAPHVAGVGKSEWDVPSNWWYEAVFRDLDGNRLCAYCCEPAENVQDALPSQRPAPSIERMVSAPLSDSIEIASRIAQHNAIRPRKSKAPA